MTTVLSPTAAEPPPVALFKRVFARFDPAVPMPLNHLYDPDVEFEDPLHRVRGVDALRAYFDRLNAGITSAEFAFGEAVLTPGAAALPWTMTVRLRRPRRTVVVPGVSLLRFDDRITHHRDYFDVGAMLYEQIPVVGRILRWAKRQVA